MKKIDENNNVKQIKSEQRDDKSSSRNEETEHPIQELLDENFGLYDKRTHATYDKDKHKLIPNKNSKMVEHTQFIKLEKQEDMKKLEKMLGMNNKIASWNYLAMNMDYDNLIQVSCSRIAKELGRDTENIRKAVKHLEKNWFIAKIDETQKRNAVYMINPNFANRGSSSSYYPKLTKWDELIKKQLEPENPQELDKPLGITESEAKAQLKNSVTIFKEERRHDWQIGETQIYSSDSITYEEAIKISKEMREEEEKLRNSLYDA